MMGTGNRDTEDTVEHTRLFFHNKVVCLFKAGARSNVVGRGTMLQAGRSRAQFLIRSLDFSIDLVLPAALWPWGRLRL
jgi:hypothetical protein